MKENYKVEGNMIITTIGDEIGTTLEDQIEALKEVNMKYIEIRKINDIYIWKYSEEQIKQIKKEFEKNEIKVITIDTPCLLYTSPSPRD